MQKVELMEPGSQQRTTGKNVFSKIGQKLQSEGQFPGFLMDVLSRLLEPAKQGSAESQGEFGELNSPGKESPDLSSFVSLTPIEQSENKDSVDLSINLMLGTPDLSGQIKEKGDGDQENKSFLLAAFPPLESFFAGKGNILRDFLNKAEDDNSSISKALFLNKGEGPAIKSDQSPINGTPASAEEPGVGIPGLVNPNQEKPVEGRSVKESISKAEEVNSSLNSALLLNKGEGLIVKSDQSPINGTLASAEDSGVGSPGLVNPNQERPIEGRSVKESPPKEAGVNSSLRSALNLNKGVGPVIKSNQSPDDETSVNAEEPGVGSTGLVNPNQERPVEGESFDLKEGLNSRLDNNLLINKWKNFVEKITQSLTAGTSRNIADTEEGKFGIKNSIEQASAKDNIPGEGLPTEIFKVQTTQDRHSSHSRMIEKVEGELSEKGKERQPGLSLFIKEGFIEEPRGPFAAKAREGSELTYGFEGLNNKDLPQNGEIRPGKGSGQDHIPPIDLTDRVPRDSIGTEKIFNDKRNPLDHFPKSFELDYLKDHYLTVKKQTPSSLEISLEPAGLGKLDLELNLTQDRLQGQIMVNDTAGKELIEKNLPQLLSELARDGLQIGGFSVSLKNQGRGQTPVPIRTEFIEPPLVTVGPDRIVPIQGNHLIHIII